MLYRDGKFYIVDQITDKWEDYDPEDELDKFMKDAGFTDDEKAVIQRVMENKDNEDNKDNKLKFKFSDGLYGIDDTRLKKIATTYIDNHKVIEKTRYEKSQYKGKGTFGFNSVKEGQIRKLALYVGTYSFADNLETTGIIETNKNKAEYNNPPIVLTYDDIKDVVEDYAKVKQLALLSNSDKNSFKAITGKDNDVKDMIFADSKTKVGESAFLSVRAFSDEDHGMYLRSSNARYANADKNSSVSAVFREIIDEGFAKIAILKTNKLTEDDMRKLIDDKKIKVNEYNQVRDVQDNKLLNPLRELKQDYLILKELYEGSTKYSISDLNNMLANNDPRGRTNFYDIKNLANMNGLVEFLGIGWNEKNINNVWTYIRHRLTSIGSEDKFYAIYNSDSVDKNVRVLRFTNSIDNNVTPLTCDNTFGLDPLYCTYDDEGNPIGGNQGGVFTNIKQTGIRTQVDYTISEDTYFNFGKDGGGINTGLDGQDPVIFGASKQYNSDKPLSLVDEIKLMNNSKRMNITIDATEKTFTFISTRLRNTSYPKTARKVHT